ncbi:hydrolase [Enterococcus timonensis]|uniref:hydrolase n=1 Tax=Enterococcus timonensis TaxID=1852364 RepID=UPI0008DB0807|nr:hydrolase [Enterococcus timonensis]
MKKLLKIILGIVLLVVVVAGGYMAYLFLSYHRLDDHLPLEVKNVGQESLTKEKSYTATTFNIGFGAYSQNFSFFMDDGDYSRAYNRQEVIKNMTGITETVAELSPTISFYQEVDVEGDRSRHVNQVAFLAEQFPEYSTVFAENYDSAYLFYPFTQPIGKAKSGLMTLAQAEMISSTRYSLPIETNFNKFFDLDRAFSATQVAVENDGILTLVNTHLSAFTKDPTIHDAQLRKLFDYIASEYALGHYVMVAGDYNHDLLGNAPSVFGTREERETWTHPFPKEKLPEHFSVPTGEIAEAKIPSVRASNIAYDPEVSYVSYVDGFILSDNIEAEAVEVVDAQFMNSDHNPVQLTFKLK